MLRLVGHKWSFALDFPSKKRPRRIVATFLDGVPQDCLGPKPLFLSIRQADLIKTWIRSAFYVFLGQVVWTANYTIRNKALKV